MFLPAAGRVAVFALLVTLVVLFALNGDVLLRSPGTLVLVSAPILLGFVVVVTLNLVVTRVAGLAYREAVVTVIIGSSSHFEIAIATAVGMYGVGSKAALGRNPLMGMHISKTVNNCLYFLIFTIHWVCFCS